MSPFDPSDIAKYRARPWHLLESAGQRFWAKQPIEAKLRAAEELAEQAARHSDWPTKMDRAADLAAHRRLAELLLRGSRGA